MLYSTLKLIHLLSAALLIGGGAATAFYLWHIYRNRDIQTFAATLRTAVLMEWWFTVPAVVLQPLTGVAMLRQMGQTTNPPWVIAALLLFSFAGLIWAVAIVIKVRLRNAATIAVTQGSDLPATFHRWMHWWFALWWAIFLLTLAILTLMVFRPAFT